MVRLLTVETYVLISAEKNSTFFKVQELQNYYRFSLEIYVTAVIQRKEQNEHFQVKNIFKFLFSLS